MDTVESTVSAERYDKKENNYILLPQFASRYYKDIGGIDLVDNFVVKYRVQIKGKNDGGQYLLIF